MSLQTHRAPRVKGTIVRFADESTANNPVTVTVAAEAGKARRLVAVLVAYTAVVTEDVTVTLDSGLGAGWDTLVQTLDLAAQRYKVFIPDQEYWFMPDDALVVVVPAGGAGIKGAVQVLVETK